MISPAEISNASPGSMVMMSSKAKATTSVSLGVAANAGVRLLPNARTQAAATPSMRRFIKGGKCFMGSSFGSIRWITVAHGDATPPGSVSARMAVFRPKSDHCQAAAIGLSAPKPALPSSG